MSLSIALLLALSVGVQAAPVAPATPGAPDLALRDSLLARFDAAFPATPPSPVVGAEPSRPPCLTQLVADLKAHWELFDAADRARMTKVLTPWKTDLVAPMPAVAPTSPPSSCFGAQGDYQLEGDHFSVEWDADSAEPWSEYFLEWLEFAYQAEVVEQGWTKPVGIDSYPILAMISTGGYSGAYTSVEYCSGVGYVPYIVAYTAAFGTSDYMMEWAQDMAAHEFNHALQFSTAYTPDSFFWEATATYMEDNVYPDHNGWGPYISGYTEAPWIGINASSNSTDVFYHMYGMAILGFLVDDHYAGSNGVRDMWNYAGTWRGDYYGLPFWDMMRYGLGYNWDDVLPEFMAAATVMDFDDSRYFPNVRIQDTVNSMPAEGASASSTEPWTNGQNFIKFDKSIDDGRPLFVTFDGEDGVDWYAILTATAGTSVQETVSFELDDEGRGEAHIDFASGDVYLVVSPFDRTAEGYDYNWDRAPSWSYTWLADLGSAPVDTSDTGKPADTGITDTSDTAFAGDTGDTKKRHHAKTVGVCGCNPASGDPAVLLGLLSLAGLVARRRSR
jgi:MYXO-CTERM domain-containing protein